MWQHCSGHSAVDHIRHITQWFLTIGEPRAPAGLVRRSCSDSMYFTTLGMVYKLKGYKRKNQGPSCHCQDSCNHKWLYCGPFNLQVPPLSNLCHTELIGALWNLAQQGPLNLRWAIEDDITQRADNKCLTLLSAAEYVYTDCNNLTQTILGCHVNSIPWWTSWTVVESIHVEHYWSRQIRLNQQW